MSNLFSTHSPCSPSARYQHLAVSHPQKVPALRIATENFLYQRRQGVETMIAKLVKLVERSRAPYEDFGESDAKFGGRKWNTADNLSDRFHHRVGVVVRPRVRTEDFVARQEFHMTKVEVESVAPETNDGHETRQLRLNEDKERGKMLDKRVKGKNVNNIAKSSGSFMFTIFTTPTSQSQHRAQHESFFHSCARDSEPHFEPHSGCFRPFPTIYICCLLRSRSVSMFLLFCQIVINHRKSESEAMADKFNGWTI